MGYRLHYCKKHDIEYGLEEGFNHQTEGVYELLSKYDCQVFADNCEDSCYASVFSVPREQIEHMLKCLRKRSPRGIIFKDAFGEKGARWTVQDAIDFFQAAYDHSPKKNSDIYFEWF